MRYIPKKPRDPQRAVPAGRCALCGGELYSGSSCWRLCGRILCEDCVLQWVLAELAPYHTVCGEVRK